MIQPILRIWFLAIFLYGTLGTGYSVLLDPQLILATRSQRDISLPLPIDQLTTVGVSLNKLVFEPQGYTMSALSDVSTLLFLGTGTYSIDVYWNEISKKWQMCPAPLPNNSTGDLGSTKTLRWQGNTYTCDPQLTLNSVFQEFMTFISATNSDLNANFLHVLLNLRQIQFNTTRNTSVAALYSSDATALQNIGNSTLTESAAGLGSYIFTPKDLASFRSATPVVSGPDSYYNQSSNRLPSLQSFLLDDFRRVVLNVLTNTLDDSSSYNMSEDEDTVFFPTTLPTSIESTSDSDAYARCLSLLNTTAESSVNAFNNISLNNRFRFVVDDEQKPFTNDTYQNYIKCGRSPIFNSTAYTELNMTNTDWNSSLAGLTNNYYPLSFWSWAVGQPQISQNGNSTNDTITSDNSSSTATPNGGDAGSDHCVALYPDGFQVSQCYDLNHYACQSEIYPNSWKIPRDGKTYFDSAQNENCPDGYFFSIPRSATELLSLRAQINSEAISYPVWVDLNDITVQNCFVSGGPYAQCPYQETVTYIEIVRMIAPSFSVAVFVILLILSEKIFRTIPVHSSRRRNWKKLIHRYDEKHGYEGVPS